MTNEQRLVAGAHANGYVNRVPPFDPEAGEHLWIWAALFRANPGTETPMLDGENLLSVQGIDCYYCEQEYSPELAARRCLGRVVRRALRVS